MSDMPSTPPPDPSGMGAPPPPAGMGAPPQTGMGGPPQPGWAGQPQATTGMDPKVGALLSYLLFGWVGGLIMYFTQKHPEVRFHAAQSIIVFGALSVINVLFSFLFPAFIGSLGALAFFGLINLVIGIGGFVLWILLCIKGYNLEHFKLPIAGDMAEQWASKPA